jgi:hypothetical protein
MIYNALIQSYFDDSSPLWGNCGKRLLDKLKKFQNQFETKLEGQSQFFHACDERSISQILIPKHALKRKPFGSLSEGIRFRPVISWLSFTHS